MMLYCGVVMTSLCCLTHTHSCRCVLHSGVNHNRHCSEIVYPLIDVEITLMYWTKKIEEMHPYTRLSLSVSLEIIIIILKYNFSSNNTLFLVSQIEVTLSSTERTHKQCLALQDVNKLMTDCV